MPKSNTKQLKNKRKVYLDHASAFLAFSANPSSIHSLGIIEKNKLEKARKNIALILSAQNNEIIFTSGSTESNNLAILGLVQNFKNPHIITTNIEHSSVLEVYKYLEENKKAEVTFVEVEGNGIVDVNKIKKSFKKNTVLVSVMYANNEIGTVQPISEIAKEIRHHNKINKENNLPNRIYFHTDATQAVNYLPISVPKLGIDLMSFNSAKIYGPKGVGVLYIKKDTPVKKIMFGGDQEFNFRPGTENVSLALGLSNALSNVDKIKNKEVLRLKKLQNYFIKKLERLARTALTSDLIINGDLKERLPNNINVTFPKIPSDLLVIELSEKGIMVSAKSACKAGDGKASHVIEAIRKTQNNISVLGKASHGSQEVDGSIRFSLGKDTEKKDIDYTVKTLNKILQKLKKWYD